MAIVQISRIQIRRGLHQDLPQLASGEFAWSVGPTTPRLWIGNGTEEEGAPNYGGRTEILTEYSNFLNFLTGYIFKGTESGYTSITGTDVNNPFTRSLQNVLDEQVSVKDFGATGNGTTDDTVAINRAIQQIYYVRTSIGEKDTLQPLRRTIKFPAGTYLVNAGNIRIPPNCTIVGDGKNNSIIRGSDVVFKTCDSLFQTDANIGINSATYPGYITIRDLGFISTSITSPAVTVENATNVIFDKVQFSGGSYGLSLLGNTANVAVTSSTFNNITTGPINVATTVGFVSRSNYFDTCKKSLSIGTTTITTLTGSGKICYEITSGTSYRAGTMTYSRSGATLAFADDYVEPSTSLGANLFANASGTLSCTVTGVSTLKYDIKQFI